MTQITDLDDQRPHAVYRCYDADDQLLYIGCARDVDYRMALQSPLVVRLTARVTADGYPNRAEARIAERTAIETEAPLLNKQHNPRRFAKHGARYVALEPVHPITARLMADSEPVPFEQIREAMNALEAHMYGDEVPA